MARTVAIGIQDFEQVITNDYFYIDKTDLIREWWESGDSVTLITRPRRFGKTLNMSMLEKFFSVEYAGKSELFEGVLSMNRLYITSWIAVKEPFGVCFLQVDISKY